MTKEELRESEFEVKWPPKPTESEISTRLKAAEAGLLTSRDYIAVLQERVDDLLKENEQKTATIRKLEKRLKQHDDNAPIDISPWTKLMKRKRDGVEDTREHTGLLEAEH